MLDIMVAVFFYLRDEKIIIIFAIITTKTL